MDPPPQILTYPCDKHQILTASHLGILANCYNHVIKVVWKTPWFLRWLCPWKKLILIQTVWLIQGMETSVAHTTTKCNEFRTNRLAYFVKHSYMIFFIKELHLNGKKHLPASITEQTHTQTLYLSHTFRSFLTAKQIRELKLIWTFQWAQGALWTGLGTISQQSETYTHSKFCVYD